jgi:hypothetical protein
MALAASEIPQAACETALDADANAFVMDTSASLIAVACGEPGAIATIGCWAGLVLGVAAGGVGELGGAEALVVSVAFGSAGASGGASVGWDSSEVSVLVASGFESSAGGSAGSSLAGGSSVLPSSEIVSPPSSSRLEKV